MAPESRRDGLALWDETGGGLDGRDEDWADGDETSFFCAREAGWLQKG